MNLAAHSADDAFRRRLLAERPHGDRLQCNGPSSSRLPHATLAWRLVCGEAELASGRLALPAEAAPGVIRLVVPRRAGAHTACS